MADDRIVGLPDEQDDLDVREQELFVDKVDALAEESATVVELAEGQTNWRYGHVIVDEAQDLSPMQWRMINRRSTGGSITIVGDLAQRSVGAQHSWPDLISREVGEFEYHELSVNYRSPSEVNEVAENILRKLNPSLRQAKAIRSAGFDVDVSRIQTANDVVALVNRETKKTPDNRIAVITHDKSEYSDSLCDVAQVLTPAESKGLEFDTVVIVSADEILEQKNGLSLLYIAATRSTSRLFVTYKNSYPDVLKSR